MSFHYGIDVLGAEKVYTDKDTVARVQQAIVGLPKNKQDPAFQPLAKAVATQKNAYGTLGPTTKKAVARFNQLYGWPSDGENITDGTLATIKRPDLQPVLQADFAVESEKAVDKVKADEAAKAAAIAKAKTASEAADKSAVAAKVAAVAAPAAAPAAAIAEQKAAEAKAAVMEAIKAPTPAAAEKAADKAVDNAVKTAEATQTASVAAAPTAPVQAAAANTAANETKSVVENGSVAKFLSVHKTPLLIGGAVVGTGIVTSLLYLILRKKSPTRMLMSRSV